MNEDARDFLSQPERIVSAIEAGLSQWYWPALWRTTAGDIDPENPFRMHFSVSPAGFAPQEWIDRLVEEKERVQSLIELSLHNVAHLSATVAISRGKEVRKLDVAVTKSYRSDPRPQTDLWSDIPS